MPFSRMVVLPSTASTALPKFCTAIGVKLASYTAMVAYSVYSGASDTITFRVDDVVVTRFAPSIITARP